MRDLVYEVESPWVVQYCCARFDGSARFCMNFCLLRVPWPLKVIFRGQSILKKQKFAQKLRDTAKNRPRFCSSFEWIFAHSKNFHGWSRFQAIYVRVFAFLASEDIMAASFFGLWRHYGSFCEHPQRSYYPWKFLECTIFGSFAQILREFLLFENALMSNDA